MNIFDREVVTERSIDKKKAANQVLESELKNYQRVVSGAKVGQKWKKALVGGLTAADEGDFTFWETLGETDEERNKNFKGDAIQMLRWMATVGYPDWGAWNAQGRKGKPPIKDNELTQYHLLMVNKMANEGFWDIQHHPELQFKLIASAGSGSKQDHHWLDMPGRKRKYTKVDELFRQKYPSINSLELDILINKSTDKDITNLCKDLAMDDKSISEILKDFNGKASKK